MRLCLVAVVAIAVSTYALPARSSEQSLGLLKRNPGVLLPRAPPPPADGPDARPTCEEGGKTRKSWEKMKMDEWFSSVAVLPKKYTEDIQKTIEGWGYTPHLSKFYCTPLQECQGTLEYDQCHASSGAAKIFFILSSLANFNGYMTSLKDGMVTTSGIADSRAGKMAEDFVKSDLEDIDSSLFPPVLAGGVLGILGAIFMGPFAPLFGVAAGAAGIATGLIINVNDGHIDVRLEQKFDSFADVTDQIANITQNVINALEGFAAHVLTDIPQNIKNPDPLAVAGGMFSGTPAKVTAGTLITDDPLSAVSVLKNGTFAEPVYAKAIPDNIYASLFSISISLLWNQERGVVVRIPKDEPTLDKGPCEIPGLFKDASWCNDNGDRFVLLKMPKAGSWLGDPWTDSVQDQLSLKGTDKLDYYSLSIKDVVQSTIKSYKSNGDKGHKVWDSAATAKYLMENQDDLEHFMAFNLWYCDLDTWSDWKLGSKEAVKNSIKAIKVSDCGNECQLLYRFINDCRGIEHDLVRHPIHFTHDCDWEDSVCRRGASHL